MSKGQDLSYKSKARERGGGHVVLPARVLEVVYFYQ